MKVNNLNARKNIRYVKMKSLTKRNGKKTYICRHTPFLVMRNKTKNTKIWRISIPNLSKHFVHSINVIYTNKWNVVPTGINDTNHLYIVSDVHIHFTNFVIYLTFMVLRNHMENHKTNPNMVDIFILSSVIFSYTSKLLSIVHLKRGTM